MNIPAFFVAKTAHYIGRSNGGETEQRKVNNGVVDKHHIMDGNAIRRPRETGPRSGGMEDHDSQPSPRRRHLMILMTGYSNTIDHL